MSSLSRLDTDIQCTIQNLRELVIQRQTEHHRILREYYRLFPEQIKETYDTHEMHVNVDDFDWNDPTLFVLHADDTEDDVDADDLIEQENLSTESNLERWRKFFRAKLAKIVSE